MPARRRTRAAASLLLAFCTTFAAHSFDLVTDAPRASACPVIVVPKPLRVLYQKSERIVVARVGNTELLQAEEGYTSLRTTMHVLENVKGGGAGSTLYVDHWGDENGQSQTFVKEDRALLFLRPGERGGGAYEVDDEQYGIKKLSDAELKIYLKRIKELSAILARQPQPDAAELVEWFVRCAEEPATRWEGAFDLSESLNASAREQKTDNEEADTGAEESEEASEEESEESEEVSTEESAEESAGASTEESADDEAETAETAAGDTSSTPTESAPGLDANSAPMLRQIAELPLRVRRGVEAADPSWIKLVTEAQKQRLSDAFFSAEKIDEGEQLLLALVENYGDPRLVPFLMRQLRRVENAPPYEAETWVSVLGRLIEDRAVKKLAVEYTEKATYYEHDVMAEGTSEADAQEASGEVVTGDAQVDAESEEAAAAAQDAFSARKRSVLLREFIAHVERATQLF
jgi:chemotaxis protein histidine kinase CheA